MSATSWPVAIAFGAGVAAATLWWRICAQTNRSISELLTYSSVDWSAPTADQLPSPAQVVPAGLLKHVGRWEGTYTHIAPDGTVQDVHECCLEIGIHGAYYSQRNTYVWRDANGAETKREVHYFPGKVKSSSRQSRSRDAAHAVPLLYLYSSIALELCGLRRRRYLDGGRQSTQRARCFSMEVMALAPRLSLRDRLNQVLPYAISLSQVTRQATREEWVLRRRSLLTRLTSFESLTRRRCIATAHGK